MKTLTTREFLKLSALATGALALPSCATSSRLKSDPRLRITKKDAKPMVGRLVATRKDASNAYPYKLFRCEEEIRKTDCIIRAGAEFRFYQNGSTRWECQVMSTDTGNAWVGYISGGSAGYDGREGTTDRLMFIMRPEYKFDIRVANQWMPWVVRYGPDKVDYMPNLGPVETYERARSIIYYCNC